MFMPDCLRLLLPTDREAPQVARCDDPKKCSSRQPSAFDQSPTRIPAGLRRFTPKKCSCRTTSGCFFHTDREAPQVACCDSSKKCSSRLPSAFGRSPAKSLSSLRKCTLKKCSCRTAFGCLSTPTARLPRRPAAIARKRAAPDDLRLPFHTDREAPQVARCDNSKKSSSRKPSTFGQSFSENLSSGPMRRPEKEQLQTAFGFWSIPYKRPCQPSEMYPQKTFRPGSFRLLS